MRITKKNMAKESVQETPVDAERQAAWEAFLAKAREQRRDKAIFDEQKARGEFDKIPDNWVK